jgi:hypothetical protein
MFSSPDRAHDPPRPDWDSLSAQAVSRAHCTSTSARARHLRLQAARCPLIEEGATLVLVLSHRALFKRALSMSFKLNSRQLFPLGGR